VNKIICKDLQGKCNSTVNLGLFYNDTLVSIMSFSKSRYNSKYEYELIRFCNLLYTNIPGAASKLLTYFERNYNPKSIISYANRRWSQGNVYEKLGFIFSHYTNPNYFYFRNSEKIESRQKFQKHKLKNILLNFDETKSESENMLSNGYNKIYDSGNKAYIKYYII